MSSIDVWDGVVVAAVVAVAVYMWRSKPKSSNTSTSSSNQSAQNKPATVVDKSFITKMKTGNKNVVIFFGSQTGTAEEFAGRLAKDANKLGFRSLVCDIEDYDMEHLERMSEVPDSLAIFCMATYGEGDPTDNAEEFMDWVKDESNGADLSSLQYVVFGLGNKTYEKYNEVAQVLNTRLSEMGGQELYELGLGDDDGNLEEDFSAWKDDMWPALCAHFGLSFTEDNSASERRYRLVTPPADAQAFAGEFKTPGSFDNQRGPFDQKNPFMARVTVNRELHSTQSDRSCRHIELDLGDSSVRYKAGDHVAVFPSNDADLVNQFGIVTGADLDQVFSLEAIDSSASKKSPFPVPTTYRTALTHYLDITSIPPAFLLRDLAEYTSHADDKARLIHLSSRLGKADYKKHVHDDLRTVLELLQDMPSIKIPIDHLCELLPRLQCRYYSISSSAKVHPRSIHVTAVVVDYNTPTGRFAKGVATNWLKDLIPSGDNFPRVPIYVRTSNFKLPKSPAKPIVMVGPGTGLAPFRGFLQERRHLKESGATMGDTILYFGCRTRDVDYLYRDELEQYEADGVVSSLHVAFSREGKDKVYVQTLMAQPEQRKQLVAAIDGGATIYICGDAKNMASEVHKAIESAIETEKGVSAKEAKDALQKVKTKGLLLQDVW